MSTMQPPDAIPQPGEVLAGKYRVERVLGQGGMGVVVAAWHVGLEERVAIKFLRASVSGNHDMVRRFLREAQAAVKIRNEHVARVTDVGTLDNGAPYIVMEHLSGADLGELIEKRGPMPIPDALECVMQACEALADAHAMGIVHRDIKPANLFLTMRSDGSPCVKILDFGISKVKTQDNQGLTKTQGMMGSPLYMSPEQLTSAKDVDHRADVYALGVVLFELLTGKQPYDAEDLPQLILQIVQGTPAPLRGFRPEVPPELEQVVMGCLVKDRNQRTQSVGQLALQLVRFAPPRAAVSAERAARITTANGRKMPSVPPAGGGGTGSTLVPLGGTKPPLPTSRAPLFVAIAIAGVVVLGGLGFGAYRIFGSRGDDVHKSPAATNDDGAKAKDESKSSGGKTKASATEAEAEAETAPPPPDPQPSAAPTPATTKSTAAAPTTKPTTPPATKPTTKPSTTTKPAATGTSNDPFGTHVY
jgi:serine/threonine-protein kinase